MRERVRNNSGDRIHKTARLSDYKLLRIKSLFAKKVDVGVVEEYELERRYKVAWELSREELMKLSNGNFLEIRQVYADLNGNMGRREVRLRKTRAPEGSIVRRIAAKLAPRKKGLRGKFERQIQIPEDDPRAEKFDELWEKHKWDEIVKTRYYIPLRLPNGRVCELHYDIHEAPSGLAGFHRIEIEFQGAADTASVDDIEADYAAFPLTSGVMPDFVGGEVTNLEPRYKSKWLAEHGTRPNDERVE